MTRIGLMSLSVALAMISLSASGCCEKEKKQIFELKSSYNQLSELFDTQRNELAQAKAANADLTGQLGEKDADLAAKDAKIGELEAKLAEAPPKGEVKASEGWERTAAGDRITVGTDVLFAAGRASLTDKGKIALDKIVNDLKTTYAGLPVRVYGYTDSDPIQKTKHLWADNLDLSANRAMAVTRHLRTNGIKAELIETVAMGATRPVVGNDTGAGKQRNRRVEIFVIRT